MFVVLKLEETPLWRDQYERVSAAVRSMFHKPRLRSQRRRAPPRPVVTEAPASTGAAWRLSTRSDPVV